MTPDLAVILMSWAVVMGGFDPPAAVPEVKMVPHEYFVANACGGRELGCNVYGWYAGKHVYLDDRLNPAESVAAASIVVHEFVHVLQYERRPGIGPLTCLEAVEFEREAYAIQTKFLTAYGSPLRVGTALARMECI